MSYSFQVRAPNKAEAKAYVGVKMDDAVRAQACHARDEKQAVAAAHAFIDVLADDETKDVCVNMSGSLTGQWTGSDVTRIESANLSVTAYLAAPEAPKA